MHHLKLFCRVPSLSIEIASMGSCHPSLGIEVPVPFWNCDGASRDVLGSNIGTHMFLCGVASMTPRTMSLFAGHLPEEIGGAVW